MICFPDVGHVIVLRPRELFLSNLTLLTYICTYYEKTKGQISSRLFVGKQTIQVKEIYWVTFLFSAF